MTLYLAVVNPTGGTGKSTTAHALAVAFAEYGKRTLMADCTSTGNLTYLLGIENPRDTTFDLFLNTSFADSSIISTPERFYFLPSDARLSYLDTREKSLQEAAGNFRKSTAGMDSPFDFVILDTPSTLSHTWMTSLLLADLYLGVTTSTLSSARGLIQTQEVAEELRKSNNASGRWLGVLPTIGAGGSVALEMLGSDFKLLTPEIPRASNVPLAEIAGKSVLNTDNSGSVALAYRELAYFLLEDISTNN